jgi:hypothetical protein
VPIATDREAESIGSVLKASSIALSASSIQFDSIRGMLRRLASMLTAVSTVLKAVSTMLTAVSCRAFAALLKLASSASKSEHAELPLTAWDGHVHEGDWAVRSVQFES